MHKDLREEPELDPREGLRTATRDVKAFLELVKTQKPRAHWQ